MAKTAASKKKSVARSRPAQKASSKAKLMDGPAVAGVTTPSPPQRNTGQSGSNDHQDLVGQQTPLPKRRAAMANLHPSDAHKAYDQKRRTSAEKKEDDEAKAATKVADTQMEQLKIDCIAALELAIGQDTEPETTPKATLKRSLHNLKRTVTYMKLPGTEVMDVDGENDDESCNDREDDADFTPPSEATAPTEFEELEDPRPKKKVKSGPENRGNKPVAAAVVADDQINQKSKKGTKMSIRDAVEKRKQELLAMGTSGKRTGVIQNWAESVQQFAGSWGSNLAKSAMNSTTVLSNSHSSATSMANALVDANDHSGGVADMDETVGPEQQAAVNSPPKNGIHLTSAGLVKLEAGNNNHVAGNRHKRGPGEGTTKKVFSNKDLPAGCLDEDHWRGWFIPTYISWIAHMEDVWSINCFEARNALQVIWDAIFGPVIPYTITISKCAVYSVAQQCLSDSWRAVIASSALIILLSILEAQDNVGLFNTDKDRQEFAEEMLMDQRFLYSKFDMKKKVGKGLFFGQVFLRIFAAHFKIIEGVRKISALGDQKSVALPPIGAAGMCAAAAERAFTLWASGNITMATIKQGKQGQKAFELVPTDELEDMSFSESKWGKEIRNYTLSA